MALYGILLLIHLLGATVWTGGHLILACVVLPQAWRARDVEALRRFESAYERIGIPALLAQVATGVWLAYIRIPDLAGWMDSSDPVARLILAKLILLAVTLALAVDARLRLIPRLTRERLTPLAWHILPVTVISVLFVVVGVSFRVGWFF